MNHPCRVLCLMTMAMAVSSIASAQSNTAFDGTYNGVSNTGSDKCTPFVSVPRPLTIRNGTVHFEGGFQNKPTIVFDGSVSAQGGLTMKDSLGDVATGNVDASGKATASIHFSGENCLLTAIWQKQ